MDASICFHSPDPPLLMRLLAPLQPQLLKGRGREKICRKNSYLGICIIARDTPPTNNQKSFEGVVHLFPRVSVLTWLREGGESDHWISYDWLGQDEEHSKSTAKCRISPICTNMPQTFKMSHELSGYLTLTMMCFALRWGFYAYASYSRKQSLIHDNQDEHNAMLTGTLSLDNGLAGVGRGRVMQSHQIVRTE